LQTWKEKIERQNKRFRLLEMRFRVFEMEKVFEAVFPE